jgi:iron complex outermembrane receptor protein
MKTLRLLLAGTGLALCCSPVLAQTAPAPDPQSDNRLEDIVVTAQKRSQNLQDVPISVAAITGDTIASSGVNSVEGISTVVPGITMTRQSAATIIFIRGIGTTGGQAGQEGAVATFVDGVYQPSMSGSTFSLNNIERIEVLKGPQGTLYGRNATGGAVNVITRDPSFTPTGQAEFGYGNRNTIDASAYVSGPIVGDVVAADLAVLYSNVMDGFGKNVVTGADVNTRRDWSARTKVLIEPSAATKIVLAADYTVNSGSYGVSLRPLPGATRILQGPTADLGSFYNIENDFNPSLRTENWGVSGRLEQDLGVARLTSITAYRDLKQYQHLDLDTGPLPLFEADLHETNWQFTQELQLASASDSKVQWIAGLFYLDAQSAYEPYNLFGLGFGAQGITGFSNRPKMRTKSYAAYGQATFPLFDDNTNLTLGARYTIDQRKFAPNLGNIEFDGSITPVPLPNQKRTFKKPTWRVALDHKFENNMMLYGSYSRGFKSGVYNLSAPADPVVRPETLDAFEVGLKSDLFDRHLRLNLAGYYYTYSDIQLTIIKGAGQSLLNAATAKVYGLDLDFEARIATSLTLRGGGQLIHARYGDFKDAPLGTVLTTFPFGTSFTPGDASGNKMIRTPTFSANAAADYHVPLASGEISANVSYSYNSGFFFEPDQRLKQKAYSIVNAQLRWGTDKDQFYIKAYAKNLLNTKYWVQQTGVFTGDLGNPAFGRQYGAAVGFKF